MRQTAADRIEKSSYGYPAIVFFNRYKNKVKYWLTFNEINSILEHPLVSGGISTPKEQLSKQDLYQAVHHEFVASALAVKIGHKINPDFKNRLYGYCNVHLSTVS